MTGAHTGVRFQRGAAKLGRVQRPPRGPSRDYLEQVLEEMEDGVKGHSNIKYSIPQLGVGEASHPEEQCEEGNGEEGELGREKPGTGALQGTADLQLRQRLERERSNTFTVRPV